MTQLTAHIAFFGSAEEVAGEIGNLAAKRYPQHQHQHHHVHAPTDGVAAPQTPVGQEPSGTHLTPLYPTGGIATERVKEVISLATRGNPQHQHHHAHAPTDNVAAPKTPVGQEPSGTALTPLQPTFGGATERVQEVIKSATR